MYTAEIYLAFIQLRKQLYKLKTTRWADKYSKIEEEQKKYKTFKRFYSACENYFSWRYKDEVTQESCQDIFDKCLELSQSKIWLKKSISM